MKCQFCHYVFISKDTFQLHQVGACPAIENEEYIIPEPLEITFKWINEEAQVTVAHAIMSDLEEKITLLPPEPSCKYLQSTKIPLQQGQYTCQLVIKNEIIPVKEITIDNLSEEIILTTKLQIHTCTDDNMVTNSDDENSDFDDDDVFHDVPGEFQTLETKAVSTMSTKEASMSETQLISMKEVHPLNKHATTNSMNKKCNQMITNNYALNKSKALKKKRKACDYSTYSIKQQNNCTVVYFNTASFNMFRQLIMQYLVFCFGSQKRY